MLCPGAAMQCTGRHVKYPDITAPDAGKNDQEAGEREQGIIG